MIETEIDMTPWEKPPCTCGHGPDGICLNGIVYESCGLPECYGACADNGTKCEFEPGCCDYERLGKA